MHSSVRFLEIPFYSPFQALALNTVSPVHRIVIQDIVLDCLPQDILIGTHVIPANAGIQVSEPARLRSVEVPGFRVMSTKKPVDKPGMTG